MSTEFALVQRLEDRWDNFWENWQWPVLEAAGIGIGLTLCAWWRFFGANDPFIQVIGTIGAIASAGCAVATLLNAVSRFREHLAKNRASSISDTNNNGPIDSTEEKLIQLARENRQKARALLRLKDYEEFKERYKKTN